jgi:hypothetical protein
MLRTGGAARDGREAAGREQFCPQQGGPVIKACYWSPFAKGAYPQINGSKINVLTG